MAVWKPVIRAGFLLEDHLNKPTNCARDASHTIAPLSTAGISGMFLERFIATVGLSKGFIVPQQTGTPNLLKRSKGARMAMRIWDALKVKVLEMS